MKYYHITDVKNFDSILSNGLLANDEGNIYLFENKSIVGYGIGYDGAGKLGYGKVQQYISDKIATSQLGLTEFAMFEISDLDCEQLINDDVAESSAACQWILHAQKIEPSHISLFGIFTAEAFGKLTEKMCDISDGDIEKILNT